MSSSPVPRPLIAKLFFAALLLLLIWIHVSLRHYAEDDAFIHFRIARNFWEHGAPFFNLDDRVQSSTSLAWIAFLSLLYGLGGLTPTVLAIINSLFVWANIAVWITVLEGWSGKRLRIKNFVITSFALAGSLFPASIALMETPLALLLIGLAFLAHVKGASGWVALFGLAIFTRPEALVFLLPLLFCRTIRSIPGGYRSLSFGAIVLGLGVVLHLFLYGSIAPHTAMVKRLVYDLSITEFTKIFFMASFGENLTQRFLPYYFFSIGVLIIRAIFVANRKHFEEVEPGVYRIAASAILLLICYTAGLSPVFQWYSPLYLVPIVAVTCSLLLGGFQTKHRIAAYILLSAPLAITISCALGAFVDVRAYPWVRSGARVGRYLQIGAAIHNSCPNASLLAPEIGGLGWTFPGTVWDGVGLATSAALEFHPMRVPTQRSAGYLGAMPLGLLREKRPEILVGPSLLLEEVQRSAEISSYQLFSCPIFLSDDSDKLGGVLWGIQEQRIYVRKDSSCLEHLSVNSSEKLRNICGEH